MLENREEELTTVRVQDPRVHNEGSWNSYVDYKIFLHVSWGWDMEGESWDWDEPWESWDWDDPRDHILDPASRGSWWEGPAGHTGARSDLPVSLSPGPARVPVPRVVQSAVLLSDSRLHLFLQSQLPVAAIEACVQGRGPHSVTEAILHYAMVGPACSRARCFHKILTFPGSLFLLFSSCAGLESFPYWSDFGMDEARPESPAGHRVTPLDSPECPAGHRVTPLDSPECPAGHRVTPLDSPECPAGHRVTPLDSPECPAGHRVTPLDSPECPAGHRVTPLDSPECPAGHRVTPLDSPECPAGHRVTPLDSPECPAGHRVTPLDSPECPAGHRVTPLDSPEEPQDVQPDTE
ncbi:PREDICTED: sorting nexin-11 [Ficedula albicollis]|uniref:sorting nexin-11 n=1 Tax=Ficedula albicollis TaxID=59894 RepID=UPI0007AD7AE3|nr:PREDICTED: sorting nexin-11 [Ficedula albicollis]